MIFGVTAAAQKILRPDQSILLYPISNRKHLTWNMVGDVDLECMGFTDLLSSFEHLSNADCSELH